jgi:hypothetical protein
MRARQLLFNHRLGRRASFQAMLVERLNYRICFLIRLLNSELFLFQVHSDFIDILSSKRQDYRTQRDRIERQVQAWKSVLPHLVTAFLEFQQRGAPAVNDNANPWGIEVISLEGSFQLSISKTGIDILTGRGIRSFSHKPNAVSSAVTLVEFGVIPASPEQPKLGFSIGTLAFYRQLRRVSPRFSLDGFSKVLNHYHSVSSIGFLI